MFIKWSVGLNIEIKNAAQMGRVFASFLETIAAFYVVFLERESQAIRSLDAKGERSFFLYLFVAYDWDF